ncbi:MAG: helix-turn-helix domain-containing protein [Alistipes sp.]|nr:helix-turn-helix domain-containing protein [Alistipes sp.]
MPILQKKVNDDFTIVHNAFIRDPKLGINGRGILLTMLSMKDGWNFSVKGLAAILPDGEKRVSTALHALEDLGYLKRTRITDKQGKVVEWEYTFSDEPIFLENSDGTSKKPKSDKKAKEKPQFRFGDVDNANVEKADVKKRHDNKILNNQILSNQIPFNQSVSQDEKIPAEKTETGGQTDGQSRSMSFAEVLEEIGFDTDSIDFVPESEKELNELDEEDRRISRCTIPYSLKADKKAMKEALKFLFAYSCYAPTMESSGRRLLDTVISALAEMTKKDIQEYQGQRVRYSDVIDRLNDVIHSTDGSLFDWFNSFVQQWNKILAENDIKHQKAYMKSCIWNWLNDYAFEEDNDLRKLDYNLKRNGVI